MTASVEDLAANGAPSEGEQRIETRFTGDREKLFGITERISSIEIVCSGILKKRYSDFVVNEIDLSGTVLHLTELHSPKVSEANEPEECEPDFTPLQSILSEEQVEKLRHIYADRLDSFVEISHLTTKEERTKLHQIIREKLSSFFGSETVQGQIRIFSSKSQAHIRDKRNLPGKSADKQYVRFLLLKENRDTVECLQYISSLLKTSVRNFSFAGTKDKRAITVQAVTVRGIPPKRLEGCNRVLKNALIGNFTMVDESLNLGALKGNSFSIAIREISISNNEKTLLESLLRELSQNGFVNYFGLQRFGTGVVSTNSIGRAILSQNWKDVVHLIMSSHDPPDSRYNAARKEWLEDKTKTEFLKLIPKRLVAESAIAGYFLANPNESNNYLGAFERIPRELRLLYLHSYQSFIWNLTASVRITLCKTKPIPGDLVLSDSDIPLILNEKNMENYSIFDVVLPIPGHSIVYSEIEPISSLYSECKELLKPSQNSLFSSLTGSYRKLIERPMNFNFHFKEYSDSNQQLVISDKELLSQNTTSSDNLLVSAGEDNLNSTGCENCQPEGDLQINPVSKHTFKALVLSFELPTSSYATMCMRECINLLT